MASMAAIVAMAKTCTLLLEAMATMAAMEAMTAIINLSMFGMKKTKQNDNELFKGWIKSVSS